VIAFVAAERREFSGLLGFLKIKRKLGWALQWAVSGELNGKDVVLAANGPGLMLAGLAADAVKEHCELEAVVSYGFCGALDPALAVNDIFVGSWGRSPICAPLPARSGRLLSVDHVVCTSTEKSELRKTGAAAVDMEAGAIAARAGAWNIPFYCIRVVTDAAHEEFAIDFNRVRDSDGRFSRWKILAAAAHNPLKLFPELIKLDRRTRSASKALGEFIATCQF
jgi:nucleoside phosphorylase